jgi:hypothetical protein
MLEFALCYFVAIFLYSGLVIVKFVLRNTDMINRDPTSFGAEFGKLAAACVELEPVRVDEIESTGLGGFRYFQWIAYRFVGCEVGVDDDVFLCVGGVVFLCVGSGGFGENGKPSLLCFG